MPEAEGFPRTPLALVVDDQEWTARSLESILGPSGFAVLKAYTGQQAMELVRKVSPDLLIIDLHLPDMNGTDVCRQARTMPSVRSSTPILMLTTGPLGRGERLEALRAGAWDVISLPLAQEELVLKVGAWVAAKQEADAAREDSLLDPETGFYNVRGLLRRVGEVTADASRHKRPLACIVMGPDWEADQDADPGKRTEELELIREVASGLVSATRLSDTIGCLGHSNYVIIAPGTDRAGAEILARRLLERVDEKRQAESEEEDRPMRAGYFAVTDFEDASLKPVDLLTRATRALRRSQSDPSGNRIRFYEN